MPSGLAWLFTLVLGAAPATIEIQATQIDPEATERGLRLRLGEGLEGWSIRVHGGGLVTDEIEAELRAPDGVVQRRSIVLTATRREDRSRELATALSLIVDEYRAKPPEPPPEPEPEPLPRAEPLPDPPTEPVPPEHLRAGWVSASGHFALGFASPVHPAAGVGLRGGLWLGRDIVQPLVAIDWSRGFDEAPTVDAIRFGAGVAVGFSPGPFWVGGSVTPRAAWIRGSDLGTATRWSSSTELAALVQLRLPRHILVAFRTGVDLTLPPVEVIGRSETVRWQEARWMVGIELGVHGPL